MRTVRELRRSEKSVITLMLDEESGNQYIQKELQGVHTIYSQLKQLEHPYLPCILSVQVEDGETTILEEYIKGSSLAVLKLTEQQAVAFMLELCEVLKALHKSGMIHRDIKPENILLAPDGHIRLIDFDAARQEKPQADTDTRLLGTRGYAAPEQFGFAQTDARTDLFSAGVTFRRLLGEHANRAAYRHILRKCTEFAPEHRYKTAAQLQNAILYRKLYMALPLIALAAVGLAAGGILWWRHINAAVITQAQYPDEPLLFYSTKGDYIIANLGDLRNQGLELSLEVDLNDDGAKESFLIYSAQGKQKAANIQADATCGAIRPDGGQLGKELFRSALEDIPDVQDYLPNETDYWHSGSLPDSYYVQITCLDLSKWDREGPAVIVSIGDLTGETVSAVYVYAESSNDFLEYRGFMWGNGAIYVTHSGTFQSPLEMNPYAVETHYIYSGGWITSGGVENVDHDDYRKAVTGGLTLSEWYNEFSSIY